MKKRNDIDSATNELSKNLIRDGIIKVKEKSDEDIRLEIRNYFLRNIKSISDFELSLDFRKGLLKNARHFSVISDYNTAIVFYALYIEHWFNQIILVSLRKKNIDLTYYNNIIRATNAQDKYTWLWQFLQLKPLNKSHCNTIDKLFEKRNSFVHYKWKSYNSTEVDKIIIELKKYKEFVLSVDKTVKYLRNYENKNVYYNKKKISIDIIKRTA